MEVSESSLREILFKGRMGFELRGLRVGMVAVAVVVVGAAEREGRDDGEDLLGRMFGVWEARGGCCMGFSEMYSVVCWEGRSFLLLCRTTSV